MNDFNNTGMFVMILRKIYDGDSSNLSSYLRMTTWQVAKTLNLLERNLLISHVRDSGQYAITQKGIEYLRAHDKFIELLQK